VLFPEAFAASYQISTKETELLSVVAIFRKNATGVEAFLGKFFKNFWNESLRDLRTSEVAKPVTAKSLLLGNRILSVEKVAGYDSVLKFRFWPGGRPCFYRQPSEKPTQNGSFGNWRCFGRIG